MRAILVATLLIGIIAAPGQLDADSSHDKRGRHVRSSSAPKASSSTARTIALPRRPLNDPGKRVAPNSPRLSPYRAAPALRGARVRRFSSTVQVPRDRAARPPHRLLDGWQIRTIDGDTFWYGAERIRIQGIDTPELSESGGFEASQRLDLMLREGPVVIVPKATDKYGRTVAEVYVNDQNAARTLVDEGYSKPSYRP